MAKISFEISKHRLIFKHPFKLAHTQRDFTEGAFLKAKSGKRIGMGEIVFPPYYPENFDSFSKFISELPPLQLQSFKEISPLIKKLLDQNLKSSFSIAALDIALHNLLREVTGQSISDHYFPARSSVARSHARNEKSNNIKKASSLTIGISSEEEMLSKIQEIEAAHACDLVKLKVSQEHIESTINCFKNNCSLPFAVDVNQGFNNKEFALLWANKLHDLGAQYIEQPFSKDDLASHQWLKNKSPIPVIADESFQRFQDLNKVKDAFDGINIKLMKCGGLSQGVLCLNAAKDLGLKTIIGCMSEASYAIEAGYELSHDADWIDLDGPFLIKSIEQIDY